MTFGSDDPGAGAGDHQPELEQPSIQNGGTRRSGEDAERDRRAEQIEQVMQAELPRFTDALRRLGE